MHNDYSREEKICQEDLLLYYKISTIKVLIKKIKTIQGPY